MRQDNSVNPGKAKKIAELHYRSRKIDQFIKWSISQKGYLKYKDLLEIQDKYKVKCYGESYSKQLPKVF